RPLQDGDHRAVRPQDHWTDQKRRVPTFLCLVALRRCRLVERECRGAGYQGSRASLWDLLSTLRLALVLWPADTPKGPPRCPWLLEDGAPEAWQLSPRWGPPVPPFVYTSRATCSPRLAERFAVSREVLAESRASGTCPTGQCGGSGTGDTAGDDLSTGAYGGRRGTGRR